MRNKILMVSALALGLSSVALAGGLPEAMPPAPCAVTSDTGIYIGIEGGYEMTNWKNVDGDVWGADTSSASRDNGLVGRGFIGYDINKYFAIEGGFTQFNTRRTIIRIGGFDWFYVRTQAIDLEAKIKAPITDEFSLYGKLGADYLMSNVKTNTGVNLSSRNNFNVLFGAGADYAVTPNIIINAEWLRYNGNPKLNINTNDDFYSDYQPYADAFMVGVRYRFDM